MPVELGAKITAQLPEGATGAWVNDKFVPVTQRQPIHVSLDLETLGTRPGSTIISIGAVAFTQQAEVTASFYAVVSRKSCREAGLTEDADTLNWWLGQSADARIALGLADTGGTTLGQALASLTNWFKVDVGEFDGIWSLGADFDTVLLAEAYRRCGFGGPPWNHRQVRCLRTLRALRSNIEPPSFRGIAHNALDDARNQAEHIVLLLKAIAG